MKRQFHHILIFLVCICSCNSNEKKLSDASVSDTLEIGSIPKQKQWDTITSLDQLKLGDTVYFKSPDDSIYLMTLTPDSVEMEEESEDSSATASLTMSVIYAFTSPGSTACDGEKFDGSDRKKSKLSIASGSLENFPSLTDLLASLPEDNLMGHHSPAITTSSTSNRVAEEKRNVHVSKAWIYAFAREGDEDYHVIIGSTANKSTATFFNVEVSGLPTSSASDFQQLSDVRKKFKDHFGLNTACAKGYHEFIDHPVRVELKGSLFFDKLHYSQGKKIGTPRARPKKYWEIHPVTEIKF